jgi:NAD(P)-dependent dehydrogenase (short-subunit alcohol dehydrogenase family)
MADVRALARRIEAGYNRLDVLLNNAGGIFTRREVTAEGLEMTFALNHMSYFLLTHELLNLLKSSAPARVVNVSSGAHQAVSGMNFDDLQSKNRYVGFSAYGRSKLANVLFTYELARRLAGTGVTANVLHPGAVSTGFGINNRGIISQLMFRVFQVMTMSPQEGAQTSIYLASSPEVANVTGSYFDRSRAVRSSPASYDETAQRRLWEMSEAIAGIQEIEYA